MTTHSSQSVEVGKVDVALVALGVVGRIPQVVGAVLDVNEVPIAQGAVASFGADVIHGNSDSGVIVCVRVK